MTGASVVVRRASGRDREAAARIFSESFTGSYRYWSLRLLNVLDLLVAVLGGEVVGAAELYTTRAEGYGKVGVIAFIAVDPRHRGRGIGRRLVEAAEEMFREQGCDYVAASTQATNTASLRLFTGLGYTAYYRGERVFDELEGPLYAYEDDVILLKSLSAGRGAGAR
ncbi:MAG: GNAT family N-acetyltransferase [Thermofilum sp.]|jgi:ribosomal protein S18 acetylase RimI-like enzyme|nr:GNAT family N-acetyltransferase [Thermofilum sp.]